MNTSQKNVHCNKCSIETRHSKIFFDNFDSNYYEEADIHWGTIAHLWKCNGCDSITLEYESYFSEDYNPITHEPETRSVFYPPRFSRKIPVWIENSEIEAEACSLFKEIYTALYNDSKRLASMGIRTLFDLYINQKVGDKGNFKNGLEELLNKGHITSSQKNIISIAVDVGNASAHRSFNPNEENLSIVLDIAENLFHLEVLDKQSAELKKATPKRIK